MMHRMVVSNSTYITEFPTWRLCVLIVTNQNLNYREVCFVNIIKDFLDFVYGVDFTLTLPLSLSTHTHTHTHVHTHIQCHL